MAFDFGENKLILLWIIDFAANHHLDQTIIGILASLHGFILLYLGLSQDFDLQAEALLELIGEDPDVARRFKLNSILHMVNHEDIWGEVCF